MRRTTIELQLIITLLQEEIKIVLKLIQHIPKSLRVFRLLKLAERQCSLNLGVR